MSLEVIQTENLDEMVGMLEEKFSTALDNQAPEVTKVITERKKKPWFNSGDLTNTTSHICGSWNLPMFLSRDGSFTLINIASLMAMAIICSPCPLC